MEHRQVDREMCPAWVRLPVMTSYRRSATAKQIYRLMTVVAYCGWASLSSLFAQPFPQSTLDSPANNPDVRPSLAIAGEPFGILLFDAPLPAGLDADSLRVVVVDDEQRVFYPAVRVQSVEVGEPDPPRGQIGQGALINRLRTAIRGGTQKRLVPVRITVSALFVGRQPLNVRLVGDIEQSVRVNVSPNSGQYALAKQTWWNDYTTVAAESVRRGDHPGLVHKCLTSLLAQRLGQPWPDLDPPDPKQKPLAQPLDTLALLAAIEPLREEILEDVLRSRSVVSDSLEPVPAAPLWPVDELQIDAPECEIESIATRVPPECFYIRFGSFSNYVWFQELSTRFGGDLAQAVLMRGFNYEVSARVERMLGAKLTTLAKLFGDHLIQDMALIGTDLYIKEGASMGALFATNNAAFLASTMHSERAALAAKTPGATLDKLRIAGREVSLLSTPDNQLRSFLVSDGEYVLVTTSQSLVKRFLEVADGQPALSNLSSFRWARNWMPEDNHYSVYAFLSPEFFHRLVSPQYQIELRRRLEAIAHLEIAEVATEMLRAESMTAADWDRSSLTLESLHQASLLPTGFDHRPDGARVLRNGDRWIDSLRGARGSFLPIADVELVGVTPAEQAGYAKTVEFYQNQWQQMDPLMFGLRRFKLEGNPKIERVAIEGYVAPFRKEKYGWIASMLGPATPVEIVLDQDDAAALQLHMRGDNLFGRPTPDYHLFAGVKDMVPPSPEESKGLIKTLRALRATPAYLGAWPMPGILDKLPLGLGGGPPDVVGFSRLLGGLWRWQGDGFSLLSFDRSILEHVIPQLAVLEANDHAQARLRVSNLQGSRLAGWINSQWYLRGWQSSQGDVRLLNSLQQQLKVPGAEALRIAERLLDVRLQCPLGGQFEFEPRLDLTGLWRSTAWNGRMVPTSSTVAPEDYAAPWIRWFRGGKIHVTQLTQRVAVVGTIDLEFEPLNPALINSTGSEQSALPTMDFDLFQLPLKIFGADSAKKSESPDKKHF